MRNSFTLVTLILLLAALDACGDSSTPTPAADTGVTSAAEPTGIATVPVTTPVTPSPTPNVPFSALANKKATLDAQSNFRPTLASISYMATQTAAVLPKEPPFPTAPAVTGSARSAASTTATGNLNSLVGITGKDGKFTATVTGAECVTEVQDTTNKKIIVPTAGVVFVIVYLDVKNEGTEPGSFQGMRLVDNKGRKFAPAISQAGLEAAAAISIRIGREVQIQPGLSGRNFILYEVPTDATTFRLEFGV